MTAVGGMEAGDGVQTYGGRADSVFDVTFDVDQPVAYRLAGSWAGIRFTFPVELGRAAHGPVRSAVRELSRGGRSTSRRPLTRSGSCRRAATGCTFVPRARCCRSAGRMRSPRRAATTTWSLDQRMSRGHQRRWDRGFCRLPGVSQPLRGGAPACRFHAGRDCRLRRLS